MFVFACMFVCVLLLFTVEIPSGNRKKAPLSFAHKNFPLDAVCAVSHRLLNTMYYTKWIIWNVLHTKPSLYCCVSACMCVSFILSTKHRIVFVLRAKSDDVVLCWAQCFIRSEKKLYPVVSVVCVFLHLCTPQSSPHIREQSHRVYFASSFPSRSYVLVLVYICKIYVWMSIYTCTIYGWYCCL